MVDSSSSGTVEIGHTFSFANETRHKEQRNDPDFTKVILELVDLTTLNSHELHFQPH